MGKEDEKQVKRQIKRFVNKDVIDKFSGTEQQIKSILPWETKQKGKTWQVTYVVTMQNSKDESETYHVKFSIKEKKSDQFQVMTVPKEKSFEINQ